MQKKYKRAIVITIVSVIVVTLVLILAGLQQVGLDQYGLNYNRVMATLSDTTVYGPGLYLLGLTNNFIIINKNQQSLSFPNLTTFTTDFYSLNAHLQVSYLFDFNTADQYSTLFSFYQSLGDHPQYILRPLIKNQILITLSSKNSTYYQNSTLANSQLQTEIASKVQSVLSNWIGSTVNVIIESLVSQGTTSNTEIIDREIQSLLHDFQRVSNQKVQLSDYFSALYSQKQFQVAAASSAIASRARNLDKVLQLVGGGSTWSGRNITKAIYDNMPVDYDMNMLNILEELVLIGNRTFPY